MRELKRERIWSEKYVFGDTAADARISDIAEKLGVSPLFAALLYNRGYTDSESATAFMNFDSTDFHDPFLLKDMDRAVERILKAVENKEKIYIYGDYDVDGVTSVSMLYLYLTSLGAEVGIKIPKRDGEGYGVSAPAVRAIAEDGAKLIITVDTGITAGAEVKLAAELGVDFVVTDHHECHSELPPACAVVNPHRADCGYPFSELAGVGVVFKTVCACEIRRAENMGTSVLEAVKRTCGEYSELVAVGTIADVMPLVDENRLIVSLGLSKLSRGEGRPGLLALLDASGKKGNAGQRARQVTSGTVGFGIAPRINAAGRMSDALIAVRLLLTSDGAEAKKYAEELCEINRRRQAEENKIASEAYAMMESGEYDNDKVIILAGDTWQQGIIGIVSSRITERYGLPSILVSFGGSVGEQASEEDCGKGSGRSIKGMDLVAALGYCEELLVKYGGHELAAGLTVKRGQIEAFRKKINEYAERHITEDMLTASEEADFELEAKDIDMSFADELSYLEPFGTGNPSPQFILRGARLARISHIGGGKHTKLILEKDGILLTAMYFGIGEGELEFKTGDTADILFQLDINDFRGVRSVQLLVRDMRAAERACAVRPSDKKRYEEIKAGDAFSAEENILPVRDDFARVYTALRREFRAGGDTMSLTAIQKEVNAVGASGIGYVKLKFILYILNELKICDVNEISDDVYRFNIFFNANKTSIEKSSILKKLRGQCNRHGSAENS